jgi:HSP20 family protein
MYPGLASGNSIKHKATPAVPFKGDYKGGKNPALVTSPAANISESSTEYLILLAVPGLSSEEFNIEIEEGVISISAKRLSIPVIPNDRQEYDLTSWTRKFALPADADPLLAHARYRRGELVVRIPRGNTIDNKNKATVYVY